MKIPIGWLQYSAIGNQVPRTRFIAFKVPLKQSFVEQLKREDRFTVPELLERVPELGLVIDLTATLKYYNKNAILDRGIDYVKISTPGQQVPQQQYVDRFFQAVDYYLDTHPNDGSLIGVHCTHGVNRTGYMLCRYLIQRLGFSCQEAIEAVGAARGHIIERSPYLVSLHMHTEGVKKKTTRGDIEEAKVKMPKKSAVAKQKKVETTRVTVGKDRFRSRESFEQVPRQDHRSRSPQFLHGRHPGADRLEEREELNRLGKRVATGSRERPQHPTSVRERLDPPLNRSRSPPPTRGRSPNSIRGPPSRIRARSQSPVRSSGMPSSNQMQTRIPPSHPRERSPMRGRSPPHMRGRTPPPSHMRRRSPPPQMRGRTPPHIRGRTPPPYVRDRTPPMRGRTPPMRGRTPPLRGRTPPMRGRTPPMRGRSPTHMRGRSPSHMRGRSPAHMRGRTPPPIRGRSPPPMRGITPPHHMRDRSPHLHIHGRSPPQLKGRSPPRIRGRTPPHMRERTPPPPPHIRDLPSPIHRSRISPPPPQLRGRSPLGLGRGRTPPPLRGRTPPPGRSSAHHRGRSPSGLSLQVRGRSPNFTSRGRSPNNRGRSPPPLSRNRSPIDQSLRRRISPGNAHRPLPPTRSRSPHITSRGRESGGVSSSRRDGFPLERRGSPTSKRDLPRGRTPPSSSRRSPVGRRDTYDSYYGYGGEYDSRRLIEQSHSYSDKYSRDKAYSSGPNSSSQYYSGTSYDQSRRDRSRSPHRREEGYYPERRDSRRETRDPNHKLKPPPIDLHEKRRSPTDFLNGREGGGPGNIRDHPSAYRETDGPDCRVLLNERRSLRDPYVVAQLTEYDDRKRSLVDMLPPKNIDLRESLEEEKRREFEQSFPPVEDYNGGERKKQRREFVDAMTTALPMPRYEYEYPSHPEMPHPYMGIQANREEYPSNISLVKVSQPLPDTFSTEAGRPSTSRGRGGKKIYDRLTRGGAAPTRGRSTFRT